MKNVALITALVASLAAPAFAQSPLELAVANHNMSAMGPSDLINTVTFGTSSARNGEALDLAIANHNASVDSAGDRIIRGSGRAFAGPTSRAAEIFAQIAAQSAEDE